MKCIVSNDVLLKNLQAVNSVVSTSSGLPILENFLFEIHDELLYITASDLETTIKVSVPVIKVEGTGEIAIPAKILVETLKTLPAIPITISADDPENPLNIAIIAGEGQFKLSGYEVADFPKAPILQDASTVTINAQSIYEGISNTLFATIGDMLRPAMTGVYWEFNENFVNFVGTDAHRLVRYRRKEVKSENAFTFILPKKSSNVLRNLLQSVNNDVVIEHNNINASFAFENYTIVCRLIDQKYPNYEAVIPLENPNKLIVNRNELINSLKRSTIYANQTTYQVRFIIQGQTLTLKSEDVDFANEATETLACNYDGQDMEIGFSSKLLIEMLQHINSESAMFELSESQRAGLILPTEMVDENEELLMLIMPIMIQTN